MPRERRKRNERRPDLATLTTGQVEHLLGVGSAMYGFGDDLESFTEAWRLHREWLFWEHVGPCPATRPLAWWICQHKIERPIVDDFLGPVAIAAKRAESFGFLHTDIMRFPHGPEAPEYFQQPEPLYLREHGLLKRGEWRAYELWRDGTGEFAYEFAADEN